MDPKLIKENADIISAIASRWDRTGELAEPDRSYLVAKIEELYGQIAGNKSDIIPDAVAEIEPAEFELTGFSFSIDTDVDNEARDDVQTSAVTNEQDDEEEEAGQGETPEENAAQNRAGDDEPAAQESEEAEVHMGRRGKSDRRTIRALYDDDAPIVTEGQEPIVESVPESHNEADAPEETPVIIEEEFAQVNQEVIVETDGEVHVTATVVSESVKVVADAAAQGAPVVINDSIGEPRRTLNERVAGIRAALGVNDRYLLIHELFGGNASAFESAVTRLDTFTDLDDAMLWIHDNYEWDPDSDGVKLLVDILVRKLS